MHVELAHVTPLDVPHDFYSESEDEIDSDDDLGESKALRAHRTYHIFTHQ